MKRKKSLDFTLNEEQEALRVTVESSLTENRTPTVFPLLFADAEIYRSLESHKGEPHG
jgi:hypothetical protein